MNRVDIINKLIDNNGLKSYLEIGSEHGSTFRGVNAEKKHGVDPVGGGQTTHPMDSDAFFKSSGKYESYDLIYIDGDHSYDQVKRDLDHALERIGDHGFVVLHNSNPENEDEQKVPPVSPFWTGDVWKVVVEARTRNDLITYTVNAEKGVTVIQKGPNPDPLRIDGDPTTLTYQDLEASRDSFLSLVDPGKFLDEVTPEEKKPEKPNERSKAHPVTNARGEPTEQTKKERYFDADTAEGINGLDANTLPDYPGHTEKTASAAEEAVQKEAETPTAPIDPLLHWDKIEEKKESETEVWRSSSLINYDGKSVTMEIDHKAAEARLYCMTGNSYVTIAKRDLERMNVFGEDYDPVQRMLGIGYDISQRLQ